MSSALAPVPFDPRGWLAVAGASQRRRLRASGLLLSCDALAAIGFAAGLAGALAELARGPAAWAPWLLLLTLSAAARGGLALAASDVAARGALEVKSKVRRATLGGVFAQQPGARRTSGESLAALVEGVEALDAYFTRFLPTRTAATVAPLLIIAAVAVASPISAAILLGALVPFVVGMALAGMAAAEESRRQFQALGRLSGVFVDRIRALPLVWAYQAEAAQTATLATRAEELRARTAKVLRVAFLSSGVLEFFAALSVALVAVYCGFNLLRLLPFHVPETLDLRRAVFALALAPEVYAPLRRLAAAYHDRQAAEAAAPALATVAPADRAAAADLRAPVLRAPPRIRFAAVSAVYPDADRPAVEGLDLDLPPGSITALMGASGAGKSTILNLLLGLAPLTDGEVWMDGKALSQSGSFATNVAWAGQSPLLIPGSIADNIRLAHPSASDDDLRRVAREVGLEGALGRRAEGMAAGVDERGGGLSGGEARRLGLARALLKPAPILLLDEPTANLDVAAAHSLLPVILAAARGRTTLIATHSAAVADLADHVVHL